MILTDPTDREEGVYSRGAVGRGGTVAINHIIE